MIWGLLFSLNQRSNFKNACGTSTLMGAIVPPVAPAHHADAILQVTQRALITGGATKSLTGHIIGSRLWKVSR